ncbi:MAG: hypothetical protein M0Z71_09700 [Nitrospiraceae bacterium]|nr:hypothetical protein [Nitrospiraceae bacterium]
MKKLKWYIALSMLLIAFSVVSYFIQIEIFHRTEDTFFYMLQDIAFVPIQVLLVTFIIARLLSERERRALLKKLNMLIGAFYGEIGTTLIKHCSSFAVDLSGLNSRLIVTTQWSDKDFIAAQKAVHAADPRFDSRKSDLVRLRNFLSGKRDFLLGLLANPNLLEHDTFTDLLWAVSHLSEELAARPALEGLPRTDYDHLSGDMKRAYVLLLFEWLSYMQHLKKDYPYLFSLAVRLNPLDPDASPMVK